MFIMSYAGKSRIGYFRGLKINMSRVSATHSKRALKIYTVLNGGKQGSLRRGRTALIMSEYCLQGLRLNYT